MKKTTSSILIGLTCVSLLSLSTGIQPVKADVKGTVNQSQVIMDSLQNFNFTKGADFNTGGTSFTKLQANNLVNGNITDKTTQISFAYNLVPLVGSYVLKDSSGNIAYMLPNRLSGQILTLSTPFKVGETYHLSTSTSTSDYLSFTVISGEVVGEPTINKVTSQDKNITGKGLSGATINLTIGGDNYTTTVDSSGNYSISLNKTYDLNSAITLYQEMDGVKSNVVKETVVAPDKLSVPKLNTVTATDKKVTGEGIAGATVHLNIGGDDYTGTVDSSGNYSISLNKLYATNSAIALYQEKDGIKSDTVTAKVVTPDKLDIPIVNKVTDKDTTVTGTAVPGATVRLSINGSNFHSVASSNGEFSINIGKTYSANTLIEVYQELNGVKSETIEKYVQLTANFIVDKIKSNATSITGSGRPNAKISVQIQDQDFTGTVDGNGKFSIDLQGAKYKAGTNVTVTSVSSEGTETKNIQIYPQDPVIGIVYASDSDIRGVVDPDATVTITIGAEKYQTIADSDGNFRQSVNPNIVVSGARVTVYSNVDGYKSDESDRTVI